MKCKLTRELEFRPDWEGLKESVTWPSEPRVDDRGRHWHPVGTVIDHVQAWMLVANLDADAADDECEERVKVHRMKCNSTTDLKLARARLEAGIHPDDFEAFDAGEMVGYDPETGDPIPGPNADDDEDDD